MEGERAVAERCEVHDRDEERDRRRTAFDDDLAPVTHALHVDPHAGAGLVATAQQQERVVGEARLPHAEEPHRPGHLQAVHEPDDDVRVAPQRCTQPAELPVDDRSVGREGADQADARDAVHVVVGHGSRHCAVVPRPAREVQQ
jgi:hypothetical protein